MKTKDRRNSGRVTTVIYKPNEFPYEMTYWNDWQDYRDGFRNALDKSLFVNKYFQHAFLFEGGKEELIKRNNKLKKLLKRRKLMKDRSTYKEGNFSVENLYIFQDTIQDPTYADN